MSYDLEAQSNAASALGLVASGGNGMAVTLRRLTGSTRDNTTLVTTPTYAADVIASGVQEAYRAFEIDGARIKAGDIKFLLSPLDRTGAVIVQPTPGSRVVIGSATWRVETVETLSPAGNPILHTLQLRGV